MAGGEKEMMRKITRECPDCGSNNIYQNIEKGERECRDCGLIIEDKLVDFGPERRTFEDDGNKNYGRTGPPSSEMFPILIGSEIGTSADMLKLKPEDRRRFSRIKNWHHRVSTAIERNFKVAFGELRRVSSFLKLPKSVEDEAASMYKRAVQHGLVRGRSMESVVAGVLYAACRRHEIPRTLDEMGEASGIEKKEIGRTYRFVTRELHLNVKPSNPADYIPRFVSALKLSPATQSKSVEILEKAHDIELTSGRGPTGIAAAALYVASLIHGEKRTQREVADVAGVTEVTIRNRYKELIQKLKFSKNFKKK